ncbi:MAG: class I tRNA ligase family protein [Candidatus Paceibacterota bacterium]|jgi:leucyl-tRNA synthetase
MSKLNYSDIETKWRKYWNENQINKTDNDFSDNKKKFYILDMFPYPSGEGLHVGHPKGYIATDVYSRMKKMQGYNVLHPMGWDAFGLPAEQFAIKNKINPNIATEKNVKRYKEQIEMLGLNYDWDREINTTDPKYYKWTQWMWKQMYKDGLAFESFDPINWCPSCKTGLANEDLDGNACERCGTVVEKKKLRQWTIRITDYADRLLNDLDKLNWEPHIKELQRNWIGKSEGSEIDFEIKNEKLNFVILHAFDNTPESSFYPWLKDELEKRGHLVVIPELPDSNDPKVYDQVEFILKNIKFDNNTVIIGHSLGGVVALKVLEKLSNPIKKTILVGSYLENNFIDENFPEYTFDWNFDFNKIKSNSKEFILLRDIEDNLVPQENTLKLSKSLNGKLIDVVASDPHFFGKEEIEVLNQSFDKLKIFTTRADTLYGCTFMAISYTLAKEWIKDGWNASEEIKKFIAKLEKEEKERAIDFDMSKLEKEGIDTGIKAINPANGEEVPIYIANYILSDYGTGAIMAVPAHDERDYEFAKKYGVKIKQVIAPYFENKEDLKIRDNVETVRRRNIHAIVRNPKNNKYLFIKFKKEGWQSMITGGVEGVESLLEAAKREIIEETGYKNFEYIKSNGDMFEVHSKFFAPHKNINRYMIASALCFDLIDEERQDIDQDERDLHEIIWIEKDDVLDYLTHINQKLIWNFCINDFIYTENGILINSGDFDGMNSEEARIKITEKVGGKIVSKYKLKDWVFARQRYWGEPFPIVFAEDENGNRKSYAVADKDLPVILPNVENYEPTDNGESPLANIKDWVEVYGFINDEGEFESCDQNDPKAKKFFRETNTMPQWAGSSWYYLRYIDPKNENIFADKELEKNWSPVDFYVGGAEHATRHLIYARFWHKYLFDKGLVNYDEPFSKLQTVGLIMAEDGKKMSKRYGNVVNPDDVVREYGADAMRTYEMFMGPFEKAISWNTNSIAGVSRFLERVYNIFEKVDLNNKEDSKEVEFAINQTIKKVGEDIEEFKFNTAISQLMICLNSFEEEIKKGNKISKNTLEKFIQILAPFAVHICEEIWQNILGNKSSIHTSTWPIYEESKIIKEEIEMSLQISGKFRGTFIIKSEANEEEIKDFVKTLETYKKYVTDESQIKKIIIVPKRLINIVI